jgi:hypothetical protein
MPDMKSTPGMDRPYDRTENGYLRNPAEPEHRMYSLTADIVYKTRNTK